MYCINCGEENLDGSAHCVRCGNSLTSLRTDIYNKPAVSDTSVTLWNPGVAVLFSIIFSPSFGAIIHALNWKRLGEARRATVAWIWAAAFPLVGIVVISFCDNAQLDIKSQSGYLKITQFIFFVTWYFCTARAQGKFITNNLKSDYHRESWIIPLCLVVILVGSIYGLTG